MRIFNLLGKIIFTSSFSNVQIIVDVSSLGYCDYGIANFEVCMKKPTSIESEKSEYQRKSRRKQMRH